jgi:tRNA pseudouridine38-40 synthase
VPTYRLLVAYDGQPFHGFARQKDLLTVQGRLEEALSTVVGFPVVTTGAGRTDAGVHALGQVMSFTVGTALEDLPGLSRGLNALCGPAIAVLELEEAPPGFDARFSAAFRTYEYAIFTRAVHDPFSHRVAWHHPGPLDVEAMQEAGQALVGTHDFSSFGRIPDGGNAVRNVLSLSVERAEDLVVIRVSANAFVHQMVRSVVGTLVKVGEGAHPPRWVAEVLEARDRAAAGPVAPPHGLFLVEVTYPEELVRL